MKKNIGICIGTLLLCMLTGCGGARNDIFFNLSDANGFRDTGYNFTSNAPVTEAENETAYSEYIGLDCDHLLQNGTYNSASISYYRDGNVVTRDQAEFFYTVGGAHVMITLSATEDVRPADLDGLTMSTVSGHEVCLSEDIDYTSFTAAGKEGDITYAITSNGMTEENFPDLVADFLETNFSENSTVSAD